MKTMRWLIGLIFSSVLLPQSVFAQSKEPKRTAIHPAATAAITWATAAKEGKVNAENDILDRAGRAIMDGAKGELGDFDKELGQIILLEKEALAFKSNPDHPNLGELTALGKTVLPMQKQNGRWFCDLPSLLGLVKSSAQVSTAEYDIVALQNSLERYRIIGGQYPSAKQGLMALFKLPRTAPRPRRWTQTIADKEALNDPWGNPYRYQLVDGKPVITSLGPDGVVSKDDISSN